MNKGKAFEKDFQEAAKNDELFVLRLHDTSLSWQHEKTSRFQPENPCDFLVYELPNLFAIECKSTCYKSLTIQRDIKDKTSKMIKAHQMLNRKGYLLVFYLILEMMKTFQIM